MIIRALQEKLTMIEKRQDGLMAERAGVRGGYGYAVGVIGFVATLLSIGFVIMQAVRP